MRGQATIVAASLLLLVLLASHGSVLANPYAEPTPLRIRTLDEVERAVAASTGNAPTMVYANDLEHMWDGRRDMLVQAMHGENSYLARAAMMGLAAIGDEESSLILREVLADTALAFQRRLNAGTALGRMGDRASLELLQGLRVDASAQSFIYEGVVDLAIDRIERPDRLRPLIVQGPYFVEFRFLLDDISRIYVLRNALAFVSSGVIYAANPTASKSQHDFQPEEYRHICELLQDGQLYHPHSLAYDEYLIFELFDGRHMAVTRSGNTFWASDDDIGDMGRPWFAVRSDSLGAYIDRACAAER